MLHFDLLSTRFVQGVISFANSTREEKTRHSSFDLNHYLAKCIEKSPNRQEAYVVLSTVHSGVTDTLGRSLKRGFLWLYGEKQM